MSIFVSVASYRDDQLKKTIESLIKNSENPKELRVVILSQDKKKSHPSFPEYENVEVIEMDFREARGAGYARKILMDQYRGEEFFFQIDSHERFSPFWDTKMIKMFHEISKESGTNKIILSQYPGPYIPHSDGRDHYPKNDDEFWSRPTWTAVKNNWHGSWTGSRVDLKDKTKPQESHSILAGYIFALGSFVEEIPYDDRISFMGEELCVAIRAFTRGWKIYAPNEMLVWHFYTRKDRVKPWSQMDDLARNVNWIDLEMDSKKMQEKVLRGIEKGVYGIGDQKKYLEYQELVGVNFNDFYDKGIQEKTNKSPLIDEMDFSEKPKRSGWCVGNGHKECETPGCGCKCHSEGIFSLKR